MCSSDLLREDRIERQNPGNFLDRDRADDRTRIRRLLFFHTCSRSGCRRNRTSALSLRNASLCGALDRASADLQ